jgi:hypothetical protein
VRIRVDDPTRLGELLRFLDRRVDLVTRQASETEADVGVLGSFADGGRAELDSHLDGWREANPGATVEVMGLRAVGAEACP